MSYLLFPNAGSTLQHFAYQFSPTDSRWVAAYGLVCSHFFASSFRAKSARIKIFLYYPSTFSRWMESAVKIVVCSPFCGVFRNQPSSYTKDQSNQVLQSHDIQNVSIHRRSTRTWRRLG